MYTQFFGLREKPFNVTPDPRFLYLSAAHQEALASMIYGIKERRGFVSVIGEIGTGKTTLLHTLFEELGEDVKTVFIFNTRINFKQLLQNMLMELGLTPAGTDKALLLNQLNEFLIDKLSRNENVALIIDEAQNLSADVLEELRMLSNLETPREKLLQIVLVGQPELDAKLKSPALRQLKQRIGINCYLTPLNREEQLNYIKHRISIAGAGNIQLFSKNALELICRHAKGIPRIINIICDNALLAAYGRERHQVDTDIIDEIIADYQRSQIITGEKGKPSLTRPVRKKVSLIKTGFYALLFLLSLLLAAFIGIAVYHSNPAFMSRLMKPVLAQLGSLSPAEDSAIYETFMEGDGEPFEPPSALPPENIPPVTGTAKEVDSGDVLNVTHEAVDDSNVLNQAQPPVEEVPAPESEPVPGYEPDTKKSPSEITAKRGDMVSTLASKEYGILTDTICDIIKRANPEIQNLDRIYIGQKIILPPIDYDSLIVADNKDTFSLHAATFSSYKQAEQYVETVIGNEYSASITPVVIVGGQPWHRVTVGKFTDRSEALSFARNFKAYDLPSSLQVEQ